MLSKRTPDLSLFRDILQTLEDIGAPYVIIGAFAAVVYGSTRTTYDIDIIVDLAEEHIQALAAAYPPPRYYADPEQMRRSIKTGTLFNIIDSERGEKADLIPLTMDARYRQVFHRRVRQSVEIAGTEPFQVWCARPEDIIFGKLLAWKEGRSQKHETDIYDMLVFHYLLVDRSQSETIDMAYLDSQARSLGTEVVEFLESVKEAARTEAERNEPPAAASTP